MDYHPFPDWTNTSALIAVIYWHDTVISLHLSNKWHQNLCSSINSDTPKVTEINPWIYTQTRSLKLWTIHLNSCLLYVFQIFSIILWSETSFLFTKTRLNVHLVWFLYLFTFWFVCFCSDSVMPYNDSFTCATLQISTCSLFEYAFFS